MCSVQAAAKIVNLPTMPAASSRINLRETSKGKHDIQKVAGKAMRGFFFFLYSLNSLDPHLLCIGRKTLYIPSLQIIFWRDQDHLITMTFF